MNEKTERETIVSGIGMEAGGKYVCAERNL